MLRAEVVNGIEGLVVTGSTKASRTYRVEAERKLAGFSPVCS